MFVCTLNTFLRSSGKAYLDEHRKARPAFVCRGIYWADLVLCSSSAIRDIPTIRCLFFLPPRPGSLQLPSSPATDRPSIWSNSGPCVRGTRLRNWVLHFCDWPILVVQLISSCFPGLQYPCKPCLHGLKGVFIGSRCRSMGEPDGDFGHRYSARRHRDL